MDVWRNTVQKDIDELKTGQSQIKQDQMNMRDDIKDLKYRDLLHDKEISNINASLDRIQDDTSWLRRTLAKAIITSVVTALVGGIITIALYQIF